MAQALARGLTRGLAALLTSTTLFVDPLPVVADQTIQIGENTYTNHGGRPIQNDGSAVVSVTVNSGNTGSDLAVAVDPGGVVRINANQDGALLLGGYVLNVTFTNGAGSTTADITVEVVPNAYSVAADPFGLDFIGSGWQLSDVLSATDANRPTFGDTIYLTGGLWNGQAETIARSAKFQGTFNPPDKRLPVPVGQPYGHRGWDPWTRRDGSDVNWVLVTRHAGEDPILDRTYMQCNNASVAGLEGVHFWNLIWERSDTPPDLDILGGTATVTNLNASNQQIAAMLTFRNNAWSWNAVTESTFRGLQTVTGAEPNCHIGILSATGAHPGLIVQDNVFDNLWNAVVVGTGATSTHNALDVIGNQVSRIWSDTFFLKHGDNVRVNWNTVRDSKSSYLSMRYYNVDFWDTSLHKDFIHARSTGSGSVFSPIGFQAIGNLHYRGEGTPAAYPALTADGPSDYDGESGAAIFIEDAGPTGSFYISPLIEGNALFGDSPKYKLVMNKATGGRMTGNGSITHDPGNYGGTLYDSGIRLNSGTTSFMVVANILEEGVTDNGSGNTVTPNTQISRTGSSGTLDKVSTFDSAWTYNGQEMPGTLTETAFAIKATSEAYTASPPHGWRDVDFDTRDLNLPWYQNGIFDLNFVEDEYSDIVDGTYYTFPGTIARASSGTGWTRDGTVVSFGSNVLRRVDGVGTFIEEARTNSILRSEEADNASWTKTNITVTANSGAAPDLATTADTLTATAGNGTCRQGVTTTAISWTYSVWLRRISGTGTVEITAAGLVYVPVTLTSAWQRFQVTQTGVAGTSNPGIRIVTSGDVIEAWGHQAEAGLFASTYIPTTTVAVTRAADSCYWDGAGFAAVYGAPTGVVLVNEVIFFSAASGTGANQVTGFLSNGTVGHRIGQFRAGATDHLESRITNGVGFNPGQITSVATKDVIHRHAIACAIGTNQGQACADTTLSTAVSPTGAMPTITRLSIGQSEGGGSGYLNGIIRRITLYGDRKPNLSMQILTNP